MKYYYGMQSAHDAGVREHPQADILRFAPDAHEFQPESLGDCWFFEAAEIADLPSYVLPCDERGVPRWGYHDPRCAICFQGPDVCKCYDKASWGDVVIHVDDAIDPATLDDINYVAFKPGRE